MVDLLFAVRTPLAIEVRTTRQYWRKIVREKHPSMQGRDKDVQQTLANPAEIRQSRRDKSVYLYYRWFGQHAVCAVARHENGQGFLITTYLTSRIQEGEQVWRK